MLHISKKIAGSLTALIAIVATNSARAESSTSHLNSLNQAMKQAAAQTAHVADASEAQMEASFCAPGMDCYANSARSEQLSGLRKVAIHIEDRRRPQPHAEGDKLAPVGVAANKTLGAMSSAFIVGKRGCHVLTSAHSVIGTASGRFLSIDPTKGDYINDASGAEVDFYFGKTSSGKFATKLRGALKAIGRFNPWVPNSQEDWALFELPECLGNKYGRFKLAITSENALEAKGDSLRAAGFPSDKDFKLGVWEDPACSVIGTTRNSKHVLETSCNLRKGASGGPLYGVDSDGDYVAYALASREVLSTNDVLPSVDSTNANIFISISAFAHKIRPFIQEAQLAAK